MTRKKSSLFVVAALATGCLTGNSFPDHYATAWCDAIFTCVGENQVDTWLGYDSKEECLMETAQDIRNGSDFDSFQEGDSTFNKVKAESCIDEANQMLSDDSCDGTMDIVSFSLDAVESDCSEVYEN